jgi:hypothetical protein
LRRDIKLLSDHFYGTFRESLVAEHLGRAFTVVPLEDEDPVLHGATGGQGALHLGSQLVHVLLAHLDAFDDRGGFSEAAHLHPDLDAGFFTIELGENILESFVLVLAHCDWGAWVLGS